MQTLWIVITTLIMITGFVGTLLPFVPGIPLIYAGYIFYGLVTGWRDYGWGVMVVWGLVAAGMAFLDVYAGSLGAQKYGASRYALWGSIIGGIVGSITAGLPGIIVGPLVGAVVGEVITGKSWRVALRSSWGTVVGLIAGYLGKVVVATAMIGSFFWWVM